MLCSFRTSWDDKLKWLCKHIIFPLCVSIFNFLCINFQFSIFNFSLNPPVASQLPPLQREANPHKPQKVNIKTKRKRIPWINKIVSHTEIATNLRFSQWRVLFDCHGIPSRDCHGFFKASQWRCGGYCLLFLCHCEEWNDEAIHKQLFFYLLTEK